MQITTAFNPNLHVRIPQLFRYMEQEYVNDFLEKGKIRLGSYQKYRADDHEERGDSMEGFSCLDAYMKNGFLSSNLIIPNNAYLLCSSTISSKELMRKFNADSSFVISDPYGFATEIAKEIPGCKEIFLGQCVYTPSLQRFFSTYRWRKNELT